MLLVAVVVVGNSGGYWDIQLSYLTWDWQSRNSAGKLVVCTRFGCGVPPRKDLVASYPLQVRTILERSKVLKEMAQVGLNFDLSWAGSMTSFYASEECELND